jgi:hypothetical protein
MSFFFCTFFVFFSAFFNSKLSGSFTLYEECRNYKFFNVNLKFKLIICFVFLNFFFLSRSVYFSTRNFYLEK